jgi:hypothetical protein
MELTQRRSGFCLPGVLSNSVAGRELGPAACRIDSAASGVAPVDGPVSRGGATQFTPMGYLETSTSTPSA